MIFLILLGFIAIIILSLIALIAIGVARWKRKENWLTIFLALLLEKWRIVVGVFGTVIGLFIVFIVISISNEPPAPCTVELISISQKLSALVSAQDYFAQGDYDYERGACDSALADYTRAI